MKPVLAFLALLYAFGATQAEAARFGYPKWNGYALDWCLNFETGCGKPAADRWCQKKGYPGSTGFQILPQVRFQTMTIGQNAICNPANHRCDSFQFIDCAEPTFRTFGQPRYNGYRLDWCRVFENECGAPAALQYCQRLGYTRLLGFQKQGPVSEPTMTVGSNAICNPQFHGCDSFAYVRCGR